MLGIYMLLNVAKHCLYISRKPQIIWHPTFLITESGSGSEWVGCGVETLRPSRSPIGVWVCRLLLSFCRMAYDQSVTNTVSWRV